MGKWASPENWISMIVDCTSRTDWKHRFTFFWGCEWERCGCMCVCNDPSSVGLQQRSGCGKIKIDKTRTIPRLELVAAHMAVNLAANVRGALTGFQLKKVLCWSDSSIALHCNKGAGRYKQFVANRVKIRSHQDVSWRYVPIASNLADLGSRGGQVNNTDTWWSGPEWFAKTELATGYRDRTIYRKQSWS